MRKAIKHVEEKVLEVVKMVRFSDTLPFVETPSENGPGQVQDPASVNPLGAADLFTLFTADIIRKDVVFTR